MPLIDPKRRKDIAVPQPRHGKERPRSSGELSFVLSTVIEQYRWDHPESWQTFGEILAALEGTKDHFMEDVVRNYEAMKLQQNGPVHKPRLSLLPSQDPQTCEPA